MSWPGDLADPTCPIVYSTFPALLRLVRPVIMKVLIAGYPKTGTKSMNAALRQLGYSVYDYDHNYCHLSKDWIKIITKGGTKEDFYRMYKDVDASMDMPACVFWEEILEAFPDCKIILMKRQSEEVWWQSWQRQISAIDNNYMMKFLGLLSPTASGIYRYSDHVSRATFCSPKQRFCRAFIGISSTVAKKRYRDHNTAVKTRAPPEQLLEYKLQDGWEPLCKFLGKPVPDKPFPHKNQRATALDDLLDSSPVFQRMKAEMKVAVAIIVALVGVGLGYFFYFR